MKNNKQFKTHGEKVFYEKVRSFRNRFQKLRIPIIIMFFLFFVLMMLAQTEKEITGESIFSEPKILIVLIGGILFFGFIIFLISLGIVSVFRFSKDIQKTINDPEFQKRVFERIDGKEFSDKEKQIQEIFMREQFGDLKNRLSEYARHQQENYALPVPYKFGYVLFLAFLAGIVYFKEDADALQSIISGPDRIFHMFAILTMLGFFWFGVNMMYMIILQQKAYDQGQSMGYHVQWPRPVVVFLKLYGLFVLSFLVWHITSLIFL